MPDAAVRSLAATFVVALLALVFAVWLGGPPPDPAWPQRRGDDAAPRGRLDARRDRRQRPAHAAGARPDAQVRTTQPRPRHWSICPTRCSIASMRSAAELELANRTIETRVDGIGQKLNTDIAGMGVSAQTGREALRDLIEHKLEASATAHDQSAHRLREELDGSFAKMKQGLGDTLRTMSDQQRERLDESKRGSRHSR